MKKNSLTLLAWLGAVALLLVATTAFVLQSDDEGKWRVYFVYAKINESALTSEAVVNQAISVLSQIDKSVFVIPQYLPKADIQAIDNCNGNADCLFKVLQKHGVSDILLFESRLLPDSRFALTAMKYISDKRRDTLSVSLKTHANDKAILKAITLLTITHRVEDALQVYRILTAFSGGRAPKHLAALGRSMWRIVAQTRSKVFIPAGKYKQGCSNLQSCQPENSVELSPFKIDKTEITILEYGICVLAGVCTPPEVNNDGRYCTFNQWKSPLLPVNCITWNQAWAFCSFAGGRLPTEAEWEAAARGVDMRAYPWGEEMPDCTKAVFSKNGDGCGSDYPHEVGSASAGASPFGVLDMSGNLWEWTADWYQTDAYQFRKHRNPQGPKTGKYKVIRGGAWTTKDSLMLTTYYRGKHAPADPSNTIGFRCVYDITR